MDYYIINIIVSFIKSEKVKAVLIKRDYNLNIADFDYGQEWELSDILLMESTFLSFSYSFCFYELCKCTNLKSNKKRVKHQQYIETSAILMDILSDRTDYHWYHIFLFLHLLTQHLPCSRHIHPNSHHCINIILILYNFALFYL